MTIDYSEIKDIEDRISELEVSLDRLETQLEMASSRLMDKEKKYENGRAHSALSVQIKELQHSKRMIEDKIQEAEYFLKVGDLINYRLLHNIIILTIVIFSIFYNQSLVEDYIND